MTRAAHRRTATNAGFTLLEVMIALGILVTALVVVAEANMGATQDASRAKMLTVASMLARAKMNEIEFDLKHDGFSDFEEEECGDFSDDEYGGLAKFKWCYTIEKIELPENLDLQSMLGGQGGDQEDAEGGSPSGAPVGPMGGVLGMLGGGAFGSGGSSPMGGMAASLLASQFGIIRNVIEQAIRRIILTVSWPDGASEKSLTLVLYITDPDVVERGIMSPGSFMGGAGMPGQGGKGSSSGKGGGK